jgi:putative transposase
LNTEQVKRLKDLELENARLRKAVSDLTLDRLILQEVRAELSSAGATRRKVPRGRSEQGASDGRAAKEQE